jgi:hypothetical protein
LITYYIKNKVTSAKDLRVQEDEKLAKAGKDNAYPSYAQLSKERNEEKAKNYLTIRNAAGEIVRKLPVPADQSGLQRIAWDLRSAAKDPVSDGGDGFYNPFAGVSEGPKVAPGTYTATLTRWQDEKMTALGEPVNIVVKSLNHQVLPAADPEAMVSFKRKAEELQRVQQAASGAVNGAMGELNLMRKAITVMEQPEESWLPEILVLEDSLKAIQKILSGDPILTQLDMNPTPTVSDRISRVLYESKYSSAEPTATHEMSLQIAQEQLSQVIPRVTKLVDEDFRAFRTKLQDAGAPYIPNMMPAFRK